MEVGNVSYYAKYNALETYIMRSRMKGQKTEEGWDLSLFHLYIFV